ncbi:MAG: F0F1 ATP synthase subunit epsilon [Chloroflexi bacterium SZAS-1]|jgi:F-type H+-transporting ATPase subunit epsilon|nr:F0F1 ATP synthase subunit epsilon [Chloroflexi bacterium SZAS-1]HNP86450.1 F0F1 ATP synthase subunit epsilon [Kouleothrix sp.]
MPIHLEIVTAERVVLSDEVDQINAPTKDGRVGILPRHAPLLTILDTGELDIVKDGQSTPFAISGGFMEVLPTRVTILADTAERADEIDEARAEAARRSAEDRIAQRQSDQEIALAEAELRRALIRLKVAQLKRNRK